MTNDVIHPVVVQIARRYGKEGELAHDRIVRAFGVLRRGGREEFALSVLYAIDEGASARYWRKAAKRTYYAAAIARLLIEHYGGLAEKNLKKQLNIPKGGNYAELEERLSSVIATGGIERVRSLFMVSQGKLRLSEDEEGAEDAGPTKPEDVAEEPDEEPDAARIVAVESGVDYLLGEEDEKPEDGINLKKYES